MPGDVQSIGSPVRGLPAAAAMEAVSFCAGRLEASLEVVSL